MKVNIADLHPTQLYLSEKKLQDIQMLYQSAKGRSFILELV